MMIPPMDDNVACTFLPGGQRFRKSDVLIGALGALDELNAALGLLRAQLAGTPDAGGIESIQRTLLEIGAELATGQPRLAADVFMSLEHETARRNAALPPANGFVLPGADEAAARAHWARAVCRRTEREFVRAWESHPDRIFPTALAFLDRLSSLLFAWAREMEVP